MAYDSKRDRLLLLQRRRQEQGRRGRLRLQDRRGASGSNAAGKDKAAVPSRETIYLPELDAVLIGARVGRGRQAALAALRLRARTPGSASSCPAPTRSARAPGPVLQQLDGADVRSQPQAGLGGRPEQPRSRAAAGQAECQAARAQVAEPTC